MSFPATCVLVGDSMRVVTYGIRCTTHSSRVQIEIPKLTTTTIGVTILVTGLSISEYSSIWFTIARSGREITRCRKATYAM